MTLELGPSAAFVVGLLGGTHCLAMCGGIVGALTFGLPGEKRSIRGILPYQLAYNLGRILSYTLAGALVGGLGALLVDFIPIAMAQDVLRAVAAIFMMMMGLYLGGWWAALTRVEQVGAHVWRRIEPAGRKLLPIKTTGQALMLGLLWGWLPCGLVYSVLIWSMSSGGAVQGATLMLAFGLGTLPNLLLMGAAASWLSRYIKKPAIRRTAGGLVILFGLYMLLSVIQPG